MKMVRKFSAYFYILLLYAFILKLVDTRPTKVARIVLTKKTGETFKSLIWFEKSRADRTKVKGNMPDIEDGWS